MLKTVYLWANNFVTAFDEGGNQIPELQGKFFDVKDAILRSAMIQTKFYLSDWSSSPVEITKEKFLQEGESDVKG